VGLMQRRSAMPVPEDPSSFHVDDGPAPRSFTDRERAVLRIVQTNLPDSLTPFADIAAAAGMEEDDVIALLRSLLEDGSIRRFGASLKHQKAGYAHNAMVAWIADEALADAAGAVAARHPLISHCYYRPSPAPDWPYELYTMIHGRAPGEHAVVIAELIASTSLREYVVLESVRELKKVSMRYF
jgi:DNA-binding Lrp family transcriptional regulator